MRRSKAAGPTSSRGIDRALQAQADEFEQQLRTLAASEEAERNRLISEYSRALTIARSEALRAQDTIRELSGRVDRGKKTEARLELTIVKLRRTLDTERQAWVVRRGELESRIYDLEAQVDELYNER